MKKNTMGEEYSVKQKQDLKKRDLKKRMKIKMHSV